MTGQRQCMQTGPKNGIEMDNCIATVDRLCSGRMEGTNGGRMGNCIAIAGPPLCMVMEVDCGTRMGNCITATDPLWWALKKFKNGMSMGNGYAPHASGSGKQGVVRPQTEFECIIKRRQTTLTTMSISQAVLPPPTGPYVQTALWRPDCSDGRYNNSSIPTGGLALNTNGVLQGSCVRNNPVNPFSPPDFTCTRDVSFAGGWRCQGITAPITGTVTNLASICCPGAGVPSGFPIPQPSPFPRRTDPHDCCNAPSVNECALCVDAIQPGPATSASHFQNMTLCQNRCNRLY